MVYLPYTTSRRASPVLFVRGRIPIGRSRSSGCVLGPSVSEGDGGGKGKDGGREGLGGGGDLGKGRGGVTR